jgi:hypothetical protein
MTYTTIKNLSADLPGTFNFEDFKTRYGISNEMLPFVVAAVAIPAAVIIALRMKKKRKKKS